MALFGIALPDFKTARRRIQDRWPGRYFEIWPDVFEGGLYWVTAEAKGLLEGLQVAHEVRFTVPDALVPIFYGGQPPAPPDALPGADSLRARTLAGRGIAVALVEEGGPRPSVEPAGPEDAYFFLGRPGSGRYFLWRLFRSKEDARAHVRKSQVADAGLDRWIVELPFERFADLMGPPAERG